MTGVQTCALPIFDVHAKLIERKGMLDQLGVNINERGNVATDGEKMTSVPGIFAAGDMARGQSLVVWAIREGRQAAKFVDKYLMGSTDLP